MLDPSALTRLANDAVRILHGKIPSDQTIDDAKQDAVVFILEGWNAGKVQDSHLIVYAVGRLRDKYARLFEHNARTADESIRLANVRSGRRTDEPDTTLRGTYGRSGLYGPSPAERTAPRDDSDARMDIQSALGRVTRIQREVFTAVCIEGKTQASVAFERGVTQAAVSQTLAAAKARLAELLEDYA